MHEFSLIPPPPQKNCPAENFFPEWTPYPPPEKKIQVKGFGTNSPK